MLLPFLLLLFSRLLVLTDADGCQSDRDKDHRPRVRCAAQGLTAVPDGIDPGTQVLVFSQNRFSSLSWTSYSKFSALHELDLSVNFIRTIDQSGPALTNLRVLRLNNNNISSLSQNAFAFAPALMEVYLDGNGLRSLDEASFSALPSLEVVNLSHNKIQVLPPRLLERIASNGLKTFDLEDNQIQQLPDGFFSSKPELPYVYLSRNPWHCYCLVEYLHTYLDDQGHNVYKHLGPTSLENDPESVVCSTPAGLEGQAIVNLKQDDYCRETLTMSVISITHYLLGDTDLAQPKLILPFTQPITTQIPVTNRAVSITIPITLEQPTRAEEPPSPPPYIPTTMTSTELTITQKTIPMTTTPVQPSISTSLPWINASQTTPPPSDIPSTIQPTTPPSSDIPSTIQPTTPPSSDIPSTIQPTTPPPSDIPSTIQPTTPPPSDIPSTIQPTTPPPSDIPSTIQPTTAAPAYPTTLTTINPMIPTTVPSIFWTKLESLTFRYVWTFTPEHHVTSVPTRATPSPALDPPPVGDISGYGGWRGSVPWCWWLFISFLLLCILSAIFSCALIIWLIFTYVTLYRPTKRRNYTANRVTLTAYQAAAPGGMPMDRVKGERVPFLPPEMIRDVQPVFRSVLIVSKGAEAGEGGGEAVEGGGEKAGNDATAKIELVPAVPRRGGAEVFRKSLYRMISREEEIEGWMEVEESRWGVAEGGRVKRDGGNTRYSLILREDRGSTMDDGAEGAEWVVGEWEMGLDGGGRNRESWGSLIRRMDRWGLCDSAQTSTPEELAETPV